MGFFKSFFSGKPDSPEAEKQKAIQKKFEIFKYDGMRAQRMGRPDYAVKCFTEALKLRDDFETMGYLAQVYIQGNEAILARPLLERMTRMEPHRAGTFVSLANVCGLLTDYQGMAEAARQAIVVDGENAAAYYLLGKADLGNNDNLMCVAHFTQAITLKEDFTEARLERAKVLIAMGQYAEASDDIVAVLEQDSDNETALLLRGKVAVLQGQTAEAEADYRRVIEVNPFSDQAYLHLGALLMDGQRLDEAIALYDEAIEMNPSLAQAYAGRGRAKMLAGDKEGALVDVKQSMELNPQEVKGLNGEFATHPGQPGIY